jgi:type II secretory pathway component PulF
MVGSGRKISEAFERYPDVFNPMMLSMVRAGEEGGFLVEQSKKLAEYIEREVQLRNMIRAATIYPKVTVVMSIIVIFVANWIIAAVGQEGSTVLISPLTEPATWVILTPVIAVAIFYFRFVRRQPKAQWQWDKMTATLPGVGPAMHGFAMAKFGRSFGALYTSGVAIPRAVRLSADACGNEFVRSQIYPAAQMIEEGRGITEAFGMSGAFSPIVLDMTRTGETTGNIDQMLNKMAEFYEDEGTVRAKQMAVVVGVACLIVVGIYVGYVYITNMVRILGGPAEQLME